MSNYRSRMGADCYPRSPGYKQSTTSMEAAFAVAPDAATYRAACLKTLAAIGPMTADEVAGEMGVSVLTIRPRITELNKQGLIMDSGLRRKNASGKSAIVWRVIAQPTRAAA